MWHSIIMLYKVALAFKSIDKIPIFVHSNWIHVVLSCTFYSKIKFKNIFLLLWHSWNVDLHMIFFKKNFTSKFLDCLLFCAVNFFQGLVLRIWWYIKTISFSSSTFFSLLSPYSESLVKKQNFLTGFELSRQLSRLLSKSSLLFLHDYVWNCQEKS